jgi:type I restriction enzyme, S subunit
MASLPQNGRWFSDPIARPASSGARFRDGDTLLARITPCLENGKTAQVRNLGNGVVGWGSTEFIVLRAKPGQTHPNFVYLLARDPIFRDFAIQQMTGTSGRQRVPVEAVSNFELALPPLDEQVQLAAMIDALDDRIEATEKLVQLLGETIRAEVEVATAARSVVADISLLDAVSLVNGGAFTKGADGLGRMVIRIKELNSGPSETTVYNSIRVPESKTAFTGDVLFAWSGTLGLWRWFRGEAIVNQHIFKVTGKRHPIWLGWAQILQELERFQDIAAGKATTMGHITQDHLARTRVPTFSDAELVELSSRVEPLWEAQLCAGRESQVCQATRDKLLPGLLSRELRVGSNKQGQRVVL